MTIPFQELYTPKGIKVLFLENNKTPSVSLYIGFRNSGFIYDSLEKQGLAMLSGQVLQENINDQAKIALNQTHKSNKGSSVKFYKSTFEGKYFTIELESSTELLEATLSLLSDCLCHPRISQPMSYPLMYAKNEVKKQLENLEMLAEYTLLQLMFHPQSFSYSPLGLPKTLIKISKKDVKEYIINHLTQENLVVAAAGNIKADHLLQRIDASFGKLPLKSRKPVKAVQPPIVNREVKKRHIFKDIPGSMICFGLPWIAITHPDYEIAELLKIQLEALVMMALKETRGTENPDATYYNSHSALGGNILIGCLQTDNPVASKSIALVRKIFKETQTKGVNLKQLDSIKKGLLEHLKQGLMKETIALAEKIKSDNVVAAYYLFNKQTGTVRWFTNLNTALSRLQSIQQRDVNRIARSLLAPDKLFFVEIGKENHFLSSKQVK